LRALLAELERTQWCRFKEAVSASGKCHQCSRLV
jgi:hypothetical protein